MKAKKETVLSVDTTSARRESCPLSALFFLNLSSKWRWVVSYTTWLF